MAEPEEEGVFVGSGSFRVDPEKLKEKLAAYGFSSPSFAIVSLVRCAVLSGATRVTIRGIPDPATFALRGTRDGFELSFDGKPFAKRDLADPYAFLYEEGPDRERGSLLARAMLTLSRSMPRTLECVQENGLFKLKAIWQSNLSGAFPQIELFHAFEGIVRDKLRHSPIPVDLVDVWSGVGDQIVRKSIPFQADPPRAFGRLDFTTKDARGRVEMPVRIAPRAGDIELYFAGALVETVRLADFLPVPVDAFIDDRRFHLDMSAAGVVRDEVHQLAMHELAARACELAIKVCAEQDAVMRELAPLLASAPVREEWAKTLEGFETEEPTPDFIDRLFGRARFIPDRKKAYWAAVRTRWLRYAAHAVRGKEGATPELVDALRNVPLYFSTSAEPLSLARLSRMQDKDGFIAASSRTAGAGLWLLSARDVALLPEGFIVRRAGR